MNTHTNSTRRGLGRRRVIGVGVTAALTLAACGGSADDASPDDSADTSESTDDASGDTGGDTPATDGLSQEEIDTAMTTPTELLFWTWVGDIENEVALFEAEYPDIDVEVVNAGQGDAQYDKLRTVLEAGEGAPDVAQIEYQYIPSFTISGDLLDLTPYGAAEREADFVPWTWGQVSGADGEVFAYPQDTGPMGMLYREDLFEEAGIEVPTTWDEFAEAARTMNETLPDTVLANIPPNEGGAWTGLLWQAGVRPFEITSETDIGIDLAGDTSDQVADYWNGLVDEGVVTADADFTDEWYQGLNNGTYATWLTAAWGPLFLAGSAPDTAGLWRAAPLPNWDADAPASGNWGGSSNAVMATSENPIAAAKLAEFINSDPESTSMLATEQFLFPASLSVLEDPEFLAQELEFYGGQTVNQVFSDISATIDVDFTWSPFTGQVFTAFNETVGTALTDDTAGAASNDAWQERLVEYATTQGFTVTE